MSFLGVCPLLFCLSGLLLSALRLTGVLAGVWALSGEENLSCSSFLKLGELDDEECEVKLWDTVVEREGRRDGGGVEMLEKEIECAG